MKKRILTFSLLLVLFVALYAGARVLFFPEIGVVLSNDGWKDTTINFYGKVVDGQGNPLRAAKVKVEIEYFSETLWILFGQGDKLKYQREYETDADGRFNVTGEYGRGLHVLEISYPGLSWLYGKYGNWTNTSYGFNARGSTYLPDVKSPAIFPMINPGDKPVVLPSRGGNQPFGLSEKLEDPSVPIALDHPVIKQIWRPDRYSVDTVPYAGSTEKDPAKRAANIQYYGPGWGKSFKGPLPPPPPTDLYRDPDNPTQWISEIEWAKKMAAAAEKLSGSLYPVPGKPYSFSPETDPAKRAGNIWVIMPNAAAKYHPEQDPGPAETLYRDEDDRTKFLTADERDKKYFEKLAKVAATQPVYPLPWLKDHPTTRPALNAPTTNHTN